MLHCHQMPPFHYSSTLSWAFKTCASSLLPPLSFSLPLSPLTSTSFLLSSPSHYPALPLPLSLSFSFCSLPLPHSLLLILLLSIVVSMARNLQVIFLRHLETSLPLFSCNGFPFLSPPPLSLPPSLNSSPSLFIIHLFSLFISFFLGISPIHSRRYRMMLFMRLPNLPTFKPCSILSPSPLSSPFHCTIFSSLSFSFRFWFGSPCIPLRGLWLHSSSSPYPLLLLS